MNQAMTAAEKIANISTIPRLDNIVDFQCFAFQDRKTHRAPLVIATSVTRGSDKDAATKTV